MLKKEFRTKSHKSTNNGILYGVMKFLIVIFAIAIIAAIVLFSTKLENVTIEGSNHYSNGELIDLLKTNETDNNTLLFYLKFIRGANDNIPFIEKIDIELIDRNQVHLQVYEKIVTGSIEYMESFMYFDREGIIAETSNERIESIPLISGLQFKKLVLHEPIEVDKPSVFQTILNLTQLIHTYDINVGRIHFTNDLEVILFSDNMRILLGKRDSYNEQIAQLPNMFSSLNSENGVLAKDNNKKLLIDMKDFEEGQDRIIATPLEWNC